MPRHKYPVFGNFIIIQNSNSNFQILCNVRGLRDLPSFSLINDASIDSIDELQLVTQEEFYAIILENDNETARQIMKFPIGTSSLNISIHHLPFQR